jgi:ABC-type Fe3+ transport system permease subunit
VTALLENPWAALVGLYILAGCAVVVWLNERLRRRQTPRHDAANSQHRATGFDAWLLAVTAVPPLWLLMVLLWPLWAVCIWASDADEDDQII